MYQNYPLALSGKDIIGPEISTQRSIFCPQIHQILIILRNFTVDDPINTIMCRKSIQTYGRHINYWSSMKWISNWKTRHPSARLRLSHPSKANKPLFPIEGPRGLTQNPIGQGPWGKQWDLRYPRHPNKSRDLEASVHRSCNVYSPPDAMRISSLRTNMSYTNRAFVVPLSALSPNLFGNFDDFRSGGKCDRQTSWSESTMDLRYSSINDTCSNPWTNNHLCFKCFMISNSYK